MARRLIPAVLAALAAVAGACAEPLAVEDRAALTQVVVQIRAAILREDCERLLALISLRSGLTCTDSHYSHAKLVRFLRDRKSRFYQGLFDTRAFSRCCGQDPSGATPAVSEKDFFLRASGATVEITALEAGGAKVVYRSRTAGHPPRAWLFCREAGSWRMTEGFVVGGCSCG
jgi:hypothetical protein